MGDLTVKLRIEHGSKKMQRKIVDKVGDSIKEKHNISVIRHFCTRCGKHTIPGVALCTKCIERDQLYNSNRI